MSLVETSYLLIVVYSLLLLLYMVRGLKKAINSTFLMLMCCNIFANLGYFWYLSAKSEGEAMVGMRAAYFGGVAMLYFMFRVIVSVCKIKVPKWVDLILVAATIATIIVSNMIGMNELFYADVKLVRGDGFSYLIKQYGPLHNVHLIVMLTYMIISLAASIYALFKPTLVSRNMAAAFALSDGVGVAAYFVRKMLHLNLELQPVANVIILTIDLIIIRRLFLYDANRVLQEINETRGDNGVILFDNSMRYLGCNNVAKTIFEEINEYYVEQRIPEKFEHKSLFEKLIENYKEDDIDDSNLEIIEKDDQIYRIHTRRLHKPDGRGEMGYVILILNDTQEQTYIRRIQQMNLKLEEAADAANAANRAKSSFLASMSHEIRTPINAVLGLNSIILRDTKEERTKEFSQDINNAGKSLLALINDILDFSKVEAGKMDIVPVEYQVSSLINDCQSMLYSRVREKGLKLEVVCNENIPSVLKGDEIRVRQIIINILTNAVKYTETGTVTLSADYERISPEKIIFIVAVKDTGMGISEENQKHLFESFKRVDTEKNRNIEGTGLGLSLVKNLSVLMGGDVSVESKEGVGSTFTVRIPQDVISNVPTGKLTQTAGKDNAVNTMDALSETEGRVLVVDDVVVNLKVFTHLLAKSKLEIDTADGGQKAIEMAAEKKYDIIFLDHMMPGMDGIETLHVMKESKDNLNADTPVIMLTANAIDGIREQYINEGFDDYLSKPVNFNPLKDMIDRYMK